MSQVNGKQLVNFRKVSFGAFLNIKFSGENEKLALSITVAGAGLPVAIESENKIKARCYYINKCKYVI